jgi:hypothetical protein
MSTFIIRYSPNSNASILHATKFLISQNIISLVESQPFVRAFHLRGEDVVVEVPDELNEKFKKALDSAKLQYEGAEEKKTGT